MYRIRVDIPGNELPTVRSQYMRAVHRLTEIFCEQADKNETLAHAHSIFRFDMTLNNGISPTGEIQIRISISGHPLGNTHLYYYTRKDDQAFVEFRNKNDEHLRPSQILEYIKFGIPELNRG